MKNEEQLSLNVLIIDDEPRIRMTLGFCLEGDGHIVTDVGTASEGLQAVTRHVFDVAFVDLRIGADSGLDLIPQLMEQSPWLKIVMITAYASFETAVEAIKQGATDYLPKPFTPDQVRMVMRKISDLRALERQVERLRQNGEQSAPEVFLNTQNSEMKRLIEMARQVADNDVTVLIRGESGTGKGVLARLIHSWSPRAGKPFGVVHCPSLSTELLESELFGHKKGAFTGAIDSNPGRVAMVDGGTLLLDEIGDLPPALQPKLLRFIQDKAYERVGDPVTRQADVRILAATNQPLEKAVEEKRFREDLFYRLNVIELTLPPLRQHPEDILPLAERFIDYYRKKYNKPLNGYSDAAHTILREHAWPGNVRELQNAIERAVILCNTDTIEPDHFPMYRPASPKVPQVGTMVTLAELEAEHIRRVIASTPRLEDAARILDIDPSTLWRKRKQYDI